MVPAWTLTRTFCLWHLQGRNWPVLGPRQRFVLLPTVSKIPLEGVKTAPAQRSLSPSCTDVLDSGQPHRGSIPNQCKLPNPQVDHIKSTCRLYFPVEQGLQPSTRDVE